MQFETVAEALRRLGFESFMVSGQLRYRTTAEDGTPALRPVSPRAFDDELMRIIRDSLPPEDARRLRRTDIVETLREMAVSVPRPLPWDVVPDPEAVGIYRDANEGGIERFNKAGPSIMRVLISQLMTRQRRPRTRAPVIVVLTTFDKRAAVMSTLSNLCAGRVHEYGPGHGQPSPDCLVTVYHETPDDDDKGTFWTEVRGDRRRPAPVPVVLAEWGKWDEWKHWLMDTRPASEVMPPLWAYYAGEVVVLSRFECAGYWAGAMAIKSSGHSLAERLPKTLRPREGVLSAMDDMVRQVLEYLADCEAAEEGGGDRDHDDDLPPRFDVPSRPFVSDPGPS